jgi:hypothetical protein
MAKVCKSAFLAEKGLRLTRCEDDPNRAVRRIEFKVKQPGEKKWQAIAEVFLENWQRTSETYQPPPVVTIGYIEVKEALRGSGVGTVLYEQMLAEACEANALFRSDSHRSPFAEAFWRKQERKGRATCYAGKGGTEYLTPMRELVRDLRQGKVSQEKFDEMTRNLPVSDEGKWPCARFVIGKPCLTGPLKGLGAPAAGDPALVRAFRKAANMSAAQIRAWAKNPTAKCASLPKRAKTGKSAIAELEQVARMKSAPPSTWSAADWTKARDLVNFVGRHAAKKAPGDPCATKRVIALRNWAHQPKGCAVPTSCSRRPR